MPSQLVKEKLVQYFNEALAMENAAADRIQSRIGETPVEQASSSCSTTLNKLYNSRTGSRTSSRIWAAVPQAQRPACQSLLP